MFDAAMRGELGSLAQLVAKHQMIRKIEKEKDKLKTIEDKFEKIQTENKQDDKDVNNNYYTNFLIIDQFLYAKSHMYIFNMYLIISYKIT